MLLQKGLKEEIDVFSFNPKTKTYVGVIIT